MSRSSRLTGRISYDEIDLAYGREPVLIDIDFRVDAGEQVVLFSPDASAIASVAALLTRLVDPSAGSLCLDGADVRALPITWLRSQVSYVPADAWLSPGTILDNVACGRPGATERELAAALRAARVDELADRLERGFDTLVGEHRIPLTAGERMRVAIARALLRDAPIQVVGTVDPARSLAVGAESPEGAEALAEAIEALPADRTRLLLADTPVAWAADQRVLVFDHGFLVEEGTHDALRERGRVYGRLVEHRSEVDARSGDAAGVDGPTARRTSEAAGRRDPALPSGRPNRGSELGAGGTVATSRVGTGRPALRLVPLAER